jgi:Mechanosensitive ion channel
VLLLAHPFRVGDSIRMQAGALGGQISGTIAEIGITYVRLATSTGVISIPNSQVLNAVVGPLPDPSTYNAPQPPPPLMATPAGQPASAPPLLADRNHPKNGQPSGDHDRQSDNNGDSQPEVPPGTPEPRPSGTPT